MSNVTHLPCHEKFFRTTAQLKAYLLKGNIVQDMRRPTMAYRMHTCYSEPVLQVRTLDRDQYTWVPSNSPDTLNGFKFFQPLGMDPDRNAYPQARLSTLEHQGYAVDVIGLFKSLIRVVMHGVAPRRKESLNRANERIC